MTGSVRVLSREEILQILGKTWRGVLALIDGDRPYCFPTAHVLYEERVHFLFLKAGRKTRCIESNPRACYLVHELQEDRWFSILIEGVLVKVRDDSVLRDVLTQFRDKVFPRDPYFRHLLNVENIVDVLLSDIRAGKIPGVYRLEPETISGLASS